MSVPPVSQATRWKGPVSSSRIGSEPNRALYQGTLRSRLVTVSATGGIAGNSGMSFRHLVKAANAASFGWQLSGSRSYLAAQGPVGMEPTHRQPPPFDLPSRTDPRSGR